MTKSRHLIRKKWHPLPTDIELVQKNFADSRTQDLADALGVVYHQVVRLAAKLGLKKSAAFLAGQQSGRLNGADARGLSGRIQPGQTPWNKGVKGLQLSPATQFRPGRPAHMAHNYLPIGTQKINTDGYLVRKTTDDPMLPPAQRWTTVHRLVWEAEFGPVPAGHVVTFRPGQRTTDPDLITPDRLELITRAENMQRNSVHTQYPPELARMTLLRGVLTRQINRKAKEADQA